MATVSNYTAAESALARALYDDGGFYENFFRKRWPYAMADALTPELAGEAQLPAREITSDVLANKLLARALKHGGTPRARIDSPMSEKTERRYTIVATRLASDYSVGYRNVYATDVALKRASPAVFQWSISLPDDFIGEQQQARLALRLVEVYESGRSAVRKQDQQRSSDGTPLERAPRYFELRSDVIEGALLRIDFDELPTLSTEARRLFAVGVIVRALSYLSVLHVAVAAAAAWGYVRANMAELDVMVSPANLQEALMRIERDVASDDENRIALFVNLRDDRRAESEIVRESERAVDSARASLRSASVAERAVALTVLNRIRTQSFAERRAVIAEAESVQSYVDAVYAALGMTGQKSLETVRDRFDAYNEELAKAAARAEYRIDLNDGAPSNYPSYLAVVHLLTPVVNAAVALNAPRLPQAIRPLYEKARAILDDKVGPIAQRHVSAILGVQRGDCYKDEKAIIREELNEAVRDGGVNADAISMAFMAVFVELPTASLPLSTAVASDADIVPAVLALQKCLNTRTILQRERWLQILGAEAAARAEPGGDDIAANSYVARMRSALPVLYRRLSRAFLRTSDLALLVNQRVSELLWAALRELLAAVAESSDEFASADRAAGAMGVDLPNDPRLLSLPLVRSFYDLLGVSDNVYTAKPTPQQLQEENTPGDFARKLGLTREQTQLVLRQVASVQIRLRAGAQRSTRDGAGSTREERLARAAVQATLAELEFWLTEQLRFYEAGGADFDLNVAELDKITERSDARRRAFELDLNERRNEILRRAVIDSLEVAQKTLRQYADSNVEGNPLVALEDVDQRTLAYLSQVIEDVKQLPLSEERYAVQVSEWLQLAQVFLQRSIINLMRSSRYEDALATKFAFAYSMLFAAQRILSERRLVAESVGNKALVDAADEAGIRAVERALDADFAVLLIAQMQGRVDEMQVDDATKEQAEETLAALKRFRAGTEPIPLPSDAVAAASLDASYQQAVARVREYHDAYGASSVTGRTPQSAAETIDAYQRQLRAVADGLDANTFAEISNQIIAQQYRQWYQQYAALVADSDDARTAFTVDVATVARDAQFLLETMQRASPIGASGSVSQLRSAVRRLRSLAQTLLDISAEVRNVESRTLPDYAIGFSADEVLRRTLERLREQPRWPPSQSDDNSDLDIGKAFALFGNNGDSDDVDTYLGFINEFSEAMQEQWFKDDQVFAVAPNDAALAALREAQSRPSFSSTGSIARDLAILVEIYNTQRDVVLVHNSALRQIQQLIDADDSAVEQSIAAALLANMQRMEQLAAELPELYKSRSIGDALRQNQFLVSSLADVYAKTANDAANGINESLTRRGLLEAAQAGGEGIVQLQKKVVQLQTELSRTTRLYNDAIRRLSRSEEQLRNAQQIEDFPAAELRALAEEYDFDYRDVSRWRKALGSGASVSDAKLDTLRRNIASLEQRVQEFDDKISTRVNALQQRIDGLNSDAARIAGEIESFRASRAALVGEVAQKEIVEKYTKDLESIRKSVLADVKKQIKDEQLTLVQIDDRVEAAFEERVRAIDSKLADYEKRFIDRAETSVSAKLSSIEREQTRLAADVAKVDEDVKKTETQLRADADRLSKRAKTVSEAFVSLVGARSALQSTTVPPRVEVPDDSDKRARRGPNLVPDNDDDKPSDVEMRRGTGRARPASQTPGSSGRAAQRARRQEPAAPSQAATSGTSGIQASVPLDLSWGGAGISHL